MDTRTINRHIEDLHMNSGVVYVNGRVDDFHQNGGINYGSSSKQQKTQELVVYRDRIVEKEVVKWKYRDREKIVYRDNYETAHLRDLLDADMEVNHRQAERIKELERIISEHRESETPCPWDVHPTKFDCEKLLKRFDLFADF